MRDHLRGKRTIILSNRSIVIQCSSVGIPLVKNILHAVLLTCMLSNYILLHSKSRQSSVYKNTVRFFPLQLTHLTEQVCSQNVILKFFCAESFFPSSPNYFTILSILDDWDITVAGQWSQQMFFSDVHLLKKELCFFLKSEM